MNERPVATFRNQPVNTIGGGEIKRGLIECEAGDLTLATDELLHVVGQLGEKLAPALAQRDGPCEPCEPCKPEPTLPKLGDSIRESRKKVGVAIEALRSMQHRCEL